MADFYTNHTPRVFIRYRTLGLVHTIKARVARGSTVPEIEAGLSKLVALLDAAPSFRRSDWSVLNAGYIKQDTGESLPLPTPTVVAGTASTAVPTYCKALQVRFEGRSVTGGRTNLTLFGANVDLDNPSFTDFRVAAGEVGFPTALWTGLSELSPNFVANDNGIANWYSYFNIKLNDSFLAALRNG
jgi:hypothetical protein